MYDRPMAPTNRDTSTIDPVDRSPRVRLTVFRDAAEAEHWAALLAAEGIEARVEIDDAQRSLPGQTILPGALIAPGGLFAYPLTVAAYDRARAAQTMGRLDRSRSPSTGSLLRNTAIALALGLSALVLRAALS